MQLKIETIEKSYKLGNSLRDLSFYVDKLLINLDKMDEQINNNNPEIAKFITGECVYDAHVLISKVQKVKGQINALNNDVQELPLVY